MVRGRIGLKSAQPRLADQAAPFPLGLKPNSDGARVVPSRTPGLTRYQFFN